MNKKIENKEKERKEITKALDKNKEQLDDLRTIEYCRLIEELKKHGLTQKDIADKIKTSEQHISNRKAGRGVTSEKQLNRLRSLLK